MKQFRSIILQNIKKIRGWLEPVFKPRGDELVLDLGCGIGTFGKIMRPFFSQGGYITGIDLDPTFVDYGNQHWAKRENIHLQVGNVHDLDFPDRYFDIVTSLGCIEFIPDINRALSEVIRVLKRPGKFIVMCASLLEHEQLPGNESFEKFHHDNIEGMRKLAIDLDFKRFKAACKAQNLHIQTFKHTLEHSYLITKEFIDMAAQNINEFKLGDSILNDMFEYHYQFLKYMGWSEETLWNYLKHQLYSPDGYINFLKEHVGEAYYRKDTFFIFLILVNNK